MRKQMSILLAAALLGLCSCGSKETADPAADQVADVVQEEEADVSIEEENPNTALSKTAFTEEDAGESDEESREEPDKETQEEPADAAAKENSPEPEEEQPAMQDHSAEFVGFWWDTVSQRCNMEIQSKDGISYTIDINWASSATDNTHWVFDGTYDEKLGGIHYQGSRVEEYYPNEGGMEATYVYTDGEGLIRIGDDGRLCWDDYVEQEGERCSFEK